MSGKDLNQLLVDLGNLKQKIKVGERFYHYKHHDQFYTIVAIGFIEATEEPCVVYQANYGDEFTWVRSETDFFAKVTLEDGREVDRFTKVG